MYAYNLGALLAETEGCDGEGFYARRLDGLVGEEEVVGFREAGVDVICVVVAGD